jgi:hypothetical protein
MTISNDEAWREIKESLLRLLEAYDCPKEKAMDYLEDVESDLESFVREH